MKTIPLSFSKHLLVVTTSLSLLACGSASELETETTPSMSPSEIVNTVMEWWPGDYNNDAQIAALREDGAPIWQEDIKENTLGGHLPANSYYRKVDMPAFGEHVLYLEEFSFKKNPYRQLISKGKGSSPSPRRRNPTRNSRGFFARKDAIRSGRPR